MNSETKEYTGHITKITIRFADIDKLGHVNNAKYLTYLESARIKYFMDIVGEEVNWTVNGIILASATVDFKAPVELNDEEVIVYTTCSKIGKKSFELSYAIVKAKSGDLAAVGATTMVCFNYKENKTIEVPDLWKRKMEQGI